VAPNNSTDPAYRAANGDPVKLLLDNSRPIVARQTGSKSRRGRPVFPRSWFGNLMLLHEQRPVSSSRRHCSAKMAKVPGEDQSAPGGSHRHHDTVNEIETGLGVSLDEIEGMVMLAIGRTI
jgi:hypothetical protein